jgi:hypothetical protein
MADQYTPSLTRISDVSSNKITEIYERLGAKFLYGNLPIFDQYGEHLRMPRPRLRFKSVSDAMDIMRSKYNLNSENLTMLHDWITNGEPIACLVRCDKFDNAENQPGLPVHQQPEIPPYEIPPYEIPPPIKLTRTTKIYNIDDQPYEKFPSAPSVVYMAFSDVQL